MEAINSSQKTTQPMVSAIELSSVARGFCINDLRQIIWIYVILMNLVFPIPGFGQAAKKIQTDSLKVLFVQEKDPDRKISLALQIAHSFPGNAQGDSMLYYSNVAKSLFKQSADSTLHTYYLYYVQILANTYLGNFKEALRISKVYNPKLNEIYLRVMQGDGVELQDLFKRSTLPSYPYNALGELYRKFGDLEQALSYHLKALECAEKLNNDIRPLADSYNNVGIVYDLLKQYDKAIGYYKKAAKINSASDKRKFNLASNYNNLGIVYKNLKKYDSAALYYKQGIRLMEESSNNYGMAVLLDNVAILYTQQGQYDKAIETEYEALTLQRKTGSKEQQAMITSNLAKNYFLKNEFGRAEELGLEAFRMSEENNYLENKKVTGELLSQIYEATGGYKEALRFHKIFKESADTLISESKNEAISNLQIRYDTEKREIENQQLTLTNVQQARLNWILGGGGVLLFVLLSMLGYFYMGKQKINRQLGIQKHLIETNLHEKESLLREIHHRVKNNLQVVSSLLNLQSYHLQDPGMINAIAEGQSRVKAMALIHQKLYQSEHLSEIDFQEYTEQLITYLATAFGHADKKISSKVNGTNIKLDINTAIPLGLILNELITNAYKYAFKDVTEGAIKIDLRKEEFQQYSLSVVDNGRGLPINFDENKLNSLGLQLVKMLIEQLDGSLTIHSDKGTHFYIRFKENSVSS